MSSESSLPSYEELFGDLSFRPADESRSVLSPAAYLADLLELIDDSFEVFPLTQRRPGLQGVPLDTENTYTVVPYLDIVNGVLEPRVGESAEAAYERLRGLRFPLNLPFSLQDERLKKYLGRFGVTADELYRAFATRPDSDVVTRAFLGLSTDDIDAVVLPVSGDPGRFAGLQDAAEFRRATTLTAAEVRELLYGNLGVSERAAAAEFFIHQDGPRVTLDDAEKTLLWGGDGETVPEEWFDRTARFVRLARKTGLRLLDLDLVLRSCCGNRIDLAALRILAAVVSLQRRFDLPIDVVCSLAAPMTMLGSGDEDRERHLYGRVFGTPPSYSGDILATWNKAYREWVARALSVPENDIVTIVTRLRAEVPQGPFGTDEQSKDLSLLHRITRLAAALDIPVSELFGVFDAIESDPAILTHPLPFGTATQSMDLFGILAGTDAGSRLWLVQLLDVIVTWMTTYGFGAQELIQLLGGAAAKVSEQDTAQQAEVVANLRREFRNVGMDRDVFVSERFSRRAAEIIHDVLTTRDDGVVSGLHPRLLRVDRPTAKSAAYDALVRLSGITDEDFTGLGLDERLTAKIFTNLVLAGYVDADGVLAENRLPSTDFRLATDFEPYRASLFMLFSDAAAAEVGAVFPSDLEQLGDLTAETLAELYDNLIHNLHIDAEGKILAPDFFAVPENILDFTVNTCLDELTPAVSDRLHERARLFGEQVIALDPDSFASLDFTDAQLTDLLESLRFNGYVNKDGNFTDPVAMLGLGLADFGVALEFYPRRRAILEAMQVRLQTARTQWNTFVPEDFQDIADRAVAQTVARLLDGTYLVDDHVPEDLRALLSQPAPGLRVGPGFTAGEEAMVFQQLAAILREQQAYQLDFTALAELGFTDEESLGLAELLVDNRHLTDEFTVPAGRLGWFGNVHNALKFTVPGYEDYGKEVFFLLHKVAMATTAGIAEIVGVVADLEQRQRETLFSVLQDAFGVPAATVEAICTEVAGGAAEALDLLVAPVLLAEDTVKDVHFLLAYRRIRRFSMLAGKLALEPAEVSVAFHDQDLAGKYPETLVLPPGVEAFDALLEDWDGSVYLFGEQGYWAYAPKTRALVSPVAKPLAELSSRFTGLVRIDAAFTDNIGTGWIIGRDGKGGSHAFTKDRDSLVWTRREQVWGKIANNFTDLARIDAAFTDDEGRTYLFCGNQYVRYSGADYTQVDEGYPRTLGEWREDEGPHVRLAVNFQFALDAAFQSGDGKVHLFKEHSYLQVGSPQRPITEVWGRVRDSFSQATGIDAAYVDKSAVVLFAGNQLVQVTGGIENPGVLADDGCLQRIESRLGDVPSEFEGGVDAALVDGSDVVHLFKGNMTVALTGDRKATPTARKWGVLTPVLPDGIVDAAFVGLDGKTYIFSGNRYIRYSGADYTTVDVGYPRTIAGDWGGLTRVDAAFVLDNRTYLVGTAAEDGPGTYVRYSTKDYKAPDEGYPKAMPDSWWSLPAWPAPDSPGFTVIDTVLTGRDGLMYLFSGQDFITFDARHRWWSQPRRLAEHWDSIPFDRVEAAFLGSDGRTYVFSGGKYVRYSSADYTAADDQPAPVGTFWGKVVNNITRTGKVDATLVVNSPERHTYLFSGNQYVRYTGDNLAEIDSGYPKLLSSLKDEPRLIKLSVSIDHVDAAFSDQRNVYLFSGKQCHVVSDTAYRRYDDLASAGCVLLEDGSLVLEQGGEWLRCGSIEGTEVTRTRIRPRTLRTVPKEFRNGLDAVLSGPDGNTYLFQGTQCFDKQLNRAYPLAEEWGRPRNTVYHNNRVDAAMVGRDGRTYVFTDDQFVVYEGSAYDGDIVGEPRSIKEHWTGLATVTLAYVQDEKTYLFEKPAQDGTIRYVVYSGTDYSGPGEPGITDSGFWQIPAEQRPAGFVAPDAVLFEGDTMLLLTGKECVQYNESTRKWSYPRLINRLWRGIGQDDDTITAAFTGVDGASYFFFQDEFTRYHERAFTQRQQIRDVWARPRNEFAKRDGSGRVDAAVVAGGRTFLFSGTQYVRYSGSTYQWTDPGYPKQIARNLRKEEMFAALPETFEEVLADRIAEDAPALIDGVVANDRTVYVFVGSSCHVASRALTATLDVGSLGRIRNNIAEGGKVDAALVNGEHTLLFSGDQYVRYTGTDYDYVDDGYPRTLESGLSAELGIGALPDEFKDGIDAAFRSVDGMTYLFAGKHYLRGDTAAPAPIAGQWGKVRNDFADGSNAIDAAFVAPAGELYAFRGGQYLRYRAGEFTTADEGYPRTIKDDWGNLPASFEASITGAFGFEGRTYLVRGNEYVRYTAGRYHEIDRTYPQTFRQRWSDCGDYRLTDVATITRFVDLARSRPAGLVDLLHIGADDPFEVLAGIFGWDVDELRWVKRNGGFLPAGHDQEHRFEIEFLLKARELFELAGKLGTGPSRVFGEIWSRVHNGQDGGLEQAASVLYELLERQHTAEEWPVLSGQLHDELNMAKRDALVAAVLADPSQPGLVTTRDLFEQLLIDVDMGGEARTSKVREAIAAVQLYLHRYLLNLEQATVETGADEQATKQRLKRWWTWMRAYRTWEANRKVFLYPENYLRPELRDLKSSAFRQLEDDLLQGEITDDAVVRAYRKYLDEYTEVSRLAIAGGYVHPTGDDDPSGRDLVLFATTRTDPRRYYWRRAELRGTERVSTTWEPWEQVNVQIDADEVAPIHAFGRVFVFWATADSTAPSGSTTSVVAVKDGDSQRVSTTAATNRVKICYSFCDLNGQWLPVQSRVVDSGLSGAISELKVAVELGQSSADGHEAIQVTCSYVDIVTHPRTVTTRFTTRFALPPELSPIPIGETREKVLGEVAQDQDKALLRKELLDDAPGNHSTEARIVTFNSTEGDGDWFSLDHRGGSFLFRPGVIGAGEAVESFSLKKDNVGLPKWSHVDAAVELPGGTRLFFQNGPSTPRYLVVPKSTDPDARDSTEDEDNAEIEDTGSLGGLGSQIGHIGHGGRGWDRGGKPGPDTGPVRKTTRPQPISKRWNLPTVTAAYVANDALYLISGKTLTRFAIVDGEVAREADQGFPVELPHTVDAVFQRDDALYVFDRGEYARIDRSVELHHSLLTWQKMEGGWGGLPRGFDVRFDSVLDGGTQLYLFYGSEYVQYAKHVPVPRPYNRATQPYEVVRLTTSTAHKLNEKLLIGGVSALLDPRTQEFDEVPACSTKFSGETTIHVRSTRVTEDRLPASTHLDFDSANGIYYWEIFFHAPLLIAQALNKAQRFEAARQWYEAVFDPTETTSYWRFLPFLAVDPEALADGCLDDLKALERSADSKTLGKAHLAAEDMRGLVNPLLAKAGRLVGVFRRYSRLDDDLAADLAALASSTVHTEIERRMLGLPGTVGRQTLGTLNGLREKTAIIAGLRRQYYLLGDPDKLVGAYQDDPFDPHAIAGWRPVAYRRSVVMAYIDNLLDWGDMLFRQYTPESIDEARMLYVLAYDLLGARPEALGTRLLPAPRGHGGFEPGELDPRVVLTGDGVLLEGEGSVHRGVGNEYFTVPGNSMFAEYWVRVEDRLRKIRLSQNFLGISQPVPLFAPPIDPMALVEGVASGAGLDQITASAAAPVPQYRFSFLFRQAQALVDRVRQLGGDLIGALEKRDAEELNLLQNRQEATILDMTRAIKDAEVKAARENLAELRTGQEAAGGRVKYYQGLVDEGLTDLEVAQIASLATAGAAHLYSSANKIGAAFAYGMPQALIGPFIMGTEMGGKQAGKVFDKSSEIWESIGESFSIIGELLGVTAAHQRSMGEWTDQLREAKSTVVQIGHQVASAEQQLAMAERERDILLQDIAHKQAVASFLKDKFGTAQLYSWMSGRLGEAYFQAYNLAYDMARSAERAFQFERGLDEADVRHIRPQYWESRHNGLLAAETLGLDLERMGRAFLDADSRGMQITRQVSLLELDPVALLRLKTGGKCEIALTEAMFDRDFPGHYRRQIRTVSVTFANTDGERLGLNATLSQLGHRTVMAPDAKAVRHLLDPKGPAPATVRADWRASQRIALSQVDQYAENNGLFELRYDDDKYLPFEGTGAVSTWRLELTGRCPEDLLDVVFTVKYTAQAGDSVFTNAVRGVLKPYPAARLFDVAGEFPAEWTRFLTGGDPELRLPITPDLLPGMVSRQITGIYPKYQGAGRFVLGGDAKFALNNGQLLPTPGLSLPGNGDAGLALRFDGDRTALTGLGLVLTYKSGN
ncbi:hypothetical protein JOF56_009514 [Kibdelosporangium banguiense]|uniref:Hemopexin n=1 Tax=Kibdelosporangium banguiense TaxID=1365924 RepID=A0ABS4TXL3_9PSEU|nr:hemopexin repeat-containing protein [Kibdelosporangium banguiense]MBP2329129.1 hypothetical protein [Kibdelosporangium banguiense]